MNARGAYGLRLDGVERAADLASIPSSDSGPAVMVSQRVVAPDQLRDRRSWCSERAASISLSGELRALIDRSQRSATLLAGAACPQDQVVHPFLTAPGAVFAWWEHREALHGGAVLVGDGCFALLGDKGAGKSSALAALALRGHPVLCDDLLVVRGTRAMTGPRCLDLPPGTVQRLALGEHTRALPRGKRRLSLAPGPAEAPLRAIVFLGWAERLQARRLSPSERLHRIAASRTIPGARGSPTGLLELARLPTFELCRPHDPDLLESSAEHLLTLLT